MPKLRKKILGNKQFVEQTREKLGTKTRPSEVSYLTNPSKEKDKKSEAFYENLAQVQKYIEQSPEIKKTILSYTYEQDKIPPEVHAAVVNEMLSDLAITVADMMTEYKGDSETDFFGLTRVQSQTLTAGFSMQHAQMVTDYQNGAAALTAAVTDITQNYSNAEAGKFNALREAQTEFLLDHSNSRTPEFAAKAAVASEIILPAIDSAIAKHQRTSKATGEEKFNKEARHAVKEALKQFTNPGANARQVLKDFKAFIPEDIQTLIKKPTTVAKQAVKVVKAAVVKPVARQPVLRDNTHAMREINRIAGESKELNRDMENLNTKIGSTTSPAQINAARAELQALGEKLKTLKDSMERYTVDTRPYTQEQKHIAESAYRNFMSEFSDTNLIQKEIQANFTKIEQGRAAEIKPPEAKISSEELIRNLFNKTHPKPAENKNVSEQQAPEKPAPTTPPVIETPLQTPKQETRTIEARTMRAMNRPLPAQPKGPIQVGSKSKKTEDLENKPAQDAEEHKVYVTRPGNINIEQQKTEKQTPVADQDDIVLRASKDNVAIPDGAAKNRIREFNEAAAKAETKPPETTSEQPAAEEEKKVSNEDYIRPPETDFKDEKTYQPGSVNARVAAFNTEAEAKKTVAPEQPAPDPAAEQAALMAEARRLAAESDAAKAAPQRRLNPKLDALNERVKRGDLPGASMPEGKRRLDPITPLQREEKKEPATPEAVAPVTPAAAEQAPVEIVPPVAEVKPEEPVVPAVDEAKPDEPAVPAVDAMQAQVPEISTLEPEVKLDDITLTTQETAADVVTPEEVPQEDVKTPDKDEPQQEPTPPAYETAAPVAAAEQEPSQPKIDESNIDEVLAKMEADAILAAQQPYVSKFKPLLDELERILNEGENPKPDPLTSNLEEPSAAEATTPESETPEATTPEAVTPVTDAVEPELEASAAETPKVTDPAPGSVRARAAQWEERIANANKTPPKEVKSSEAPQGTRVREAAAKLEEQIRQQANPRVPNRSPSDSVVPSRDKVKKLVENYETRASKPQVLRTTDIDDTLDGIVSQRIADIEKRNAAVTPVANVADINVPPGADVTPRADVPPGADVPLGTDVPPGTGSPPLDVDPARDAAINAFIERAAKLYDQLDIAIIIAQEHSPDGMDIVDSLVAQHAEMVRENDILTTMQLELKNTYPAAYTKNDTTAANLQNVETQLASNITDLSALSGLLNNIKNAIPPPPPYPPPPPSGPADLVKEIDNDLNALDYHVALLETTLTAERDNVASMKIDLLATLNSFTADHSAIKGRIEGGKVTYPDELDEFHGVENRLDAADQQLKTLAVRINAIVAKPIFVHTPPPATPATPATPPPPSTVPPVATAGAPAPRHNIILKSLPLAVGAHVNQYIGYKGSLSKLADQLTNSDELKRAKNLMQHIQLKLAEATDPSKANLETRQKMVDEWNNRLYPLLEKINTRMVNLLDVRGMILDQDKRNKIGDTVLEYNKLFNTLYGNQGIRSALQTTLDKYAMDTIVLKSDEVTRVDRTPGESDADFKKRINDVCNGLFTPTTSTTFGLQSSNTEMNVFTQAAICCINGDKSDKNPLDHSNKTYYTVETGGGANECEINMKKIRDDMDPQILLADVAIKNGLDKFLNVTQPAQRDQVKQFFANFSENPPTKDGIKKYFVDKINSGECTLRSGKIGGNVADMAGKIHDSFIAHSRDALNQNVPHQRTMTIALDMLQNFVNTTGGHKVLTLMGSNEDIKLSSKLICAVMLQDVKDPDKNFIFKYRTYPREPEPTKFSSSALNRTRDMLKAIDPNYAQNLQLMNLALSSDVKKNTVGGLTGKMSATHSQAGIQQDAPDVNYSRRPGGKH